MFSQISPLRSYNDQLQGGTTYLNDEGLLDSLMVFAELELEELISRKVRPEFYKHFEKDFAGEEEAVTALHTAFTQLMESVQCYCLVVEKMQCLRDTCPGTSGPANTQWVLHLVKSIMFCFVDKKFHKSLDTFYFCGYKCFDAITRHNEDEGKDL